MSLMNPNRNQAQADEARENCMTLRDQFAMTALGALLGSPRLKSDTKHEEIAQAAYQQADAMLAVREKKPHAAHAPTHIKNDLNIDP